MKRRLLACLPLLLTGLAAGAEPSPLARLDLLPRDGTTEALATPVFGQLVLLSLPDEFRFAPAEVRRGRIVRQAFPVGENAARWTQRLTLAGDEALAFSGRTFPQKMVDDFVAGMKSGCPGSFAVLPLPEVAVQSYDTAVAVAGCGAGHGETVLRMVIKGGMDVYTIEWAVRGTAGKGPPTLDAKAWTDRIRRLSPVRLCGIVPDEKPPYPSCVDRPPARR